MDTESTKHGFLSMKLKLGCVCPQRAASLGIRSPARWIYIHENLSISRRFCGSEAGRACPKRAVVRVPAYIRGALRTTLPTSVVSAMPAWDRRALPVAAFRDAMRVFAPRILSPTLSSRGGEGEEAQAKL